VNFKDRLQAVKQIFHTPVMLKEILDYLELGPGKVVVDATAGTGGHALEIAARISPGGKLVCIDRDQKSLAVAAERLGDFHEVSHFVHGNFIDIPDILKGLGIKKADGVLFDLGISSFQLEDPERGFSFQYEGPLDMRLDRESYISAYDLVNNLNEEEISAMLWNFGQERWHNRIARLLIQERQKYPIATTRQLSNIVIKAIPYKYRHYRIHPATRTFQAVRIAVNRELETLDIATNKALDILSEKGRICVISFHSLEDRVVKLNFRKLAQEDKVRVITSKPLTPALSEVQGNPSSRSAKLRVAERL